MKFQTEKVLHPLDLGDYLGEGDNAYRGKVLSVWVNPDAKVRAERQSLLMEYARVLNAKPAPKFNIFRRAGNQPSLKTLENLRERNFAWLAVILDQDEGNPCPAADVKELWFADQVLYEWILTRAVDMMAAYQEEKKRTSNPPSKT